jgi:hypothetical protein
MRFIENGPAIPDDLLVARDEGNVIFFCGAGVSRARAGLSDFATLAKNLLDDLGSAKDSPARTLFDAGAEAERVSGVKGLVAYDRIFGMLEREFEAAEVRQAVARALRPAPDCNLEAHRVLLDLSRTRGGLARLVTTNFDRLFEACDAGVKLSNPPNLPDPLREQDFHGVIHLHGVVDEHYGGILQDELVLSSADFGHAYLASGWATRYIQTLLQRYRIVFVGYSADDPPVQYLLEALNRFGQPGNALYAFQSGDKQQAAQQWAHKGVEPILYEKTGDHRFLWDTLAGWADRARDVDGWYAKIIRDAGRGPAAMRPHERGIVAHLAATAQGCRMIADQPQTLPPEWLFVFDRRARYGNPAPMFESNVPQFDPFDAFGLDSDPLPAPPDPDNRYAPRAVPQAWDATALIPADLEGLSRQHAASFGASANGMTLLVPRLGDLARWIVRIADMDATLWWAVKREPLHPQLQEGIRFRIQGGKNISPALRKGWGLLLQSWQHKAPQADREIFEVERNATAFGWTSSVVRDAVELFRPYLLVREPFRSKPPEGREGTLDDLVRVDIEYPFPYRWPEIPSEWLALAVRLLGDQLEEALCLEEEFGTGGWYIDSISAEVNEQLFSNLHGLGGYLAVYAFALQRLSKSEGEGARAEVSRWVSTHVAFDRLRIWAAGQPELTSPEAAGQILTALDDHVFWSDLYRSDLFAVLTTRWSELDLAVTVRIETRICGGTYPLLEGNELDEAEVAHRRLDRLQLLLNSGATMTEGLSTEMARLRSMAPDWTPETAPEPTLPMPRGGPMAVDTRAELLDGLPLGDILTRAKELGGFDFDSAIVRQPFEGLSRFRPARALGAITAAGKSGTFDGAAWATLLNVNADITPRMACVIAHRLARLDVLDLAQLVGPVSDWIGNKFELLASQLPHALDVLWDAMQDALEVGPMAHKDSKRNWVDRSIRSPAGRLANAWFKHPAVSEPSVEVGLPAGWLKRLDRMLNLPGDQGCYVIAIAARRLNWFFHFSRVWTDRCLLSLAFQPMETDISRAFWAGYLSSGTVPQHLLFAEIRDSLTGLAYARSLEPAQERTLANMLLVAWRHNEFSDNKLESLTDAEMREVLVHATEPFCTATLWCFKQLSQLPEASFADQISKFLSDVWPRQKALRTPEISAKLVDLVTGFPDRFADLVQVVLPRLVPLKPQSTVLYDPNAVERLASKSPRSLLQLLSVILDQDPGNWPYMTGNVLRRLAEHDETRDELQLATLLRKLSPAG